MRLDKKRHLIRAPGWPGRKPEICFHCLLHASSILPLPTRELRTPIPEHPSTSLGEEVESWPLHILRRMRGGENTQLPGLL